MPVEVDTGKGQIMENQAEIVKTLVLYPKTDEKHKLIFHLKRS